MTRIVIGIGGVAGPVLLVSGVPSDSSFGGAPVVGTLAVNSLTDIIYIKELATEGWHPLGVTSFNTRLGAIVPVTGDYSVAQVTGAAPLASPAITGTPTAPTQSPGNNSTRLGTTAYTDAAVAAAIGITSYRSTLISTTLSATDRIVGVRSTSATRTITLAPASSLTNGTQIIVKDESGAASGTGITVITQGIDTIDGATSLLINTDYGAIVMYAQANGYSVIPGVSTQAPQPPGPVTPPVIT